MMSVQDYKLTIIIYLSSLIIFVKHSTSLNEWRCPMIRYAVIFFVIALVAALFGFTGIAAGATEIAKILFFVFLVIAAISFIMSLIKKAPG